MYAFPKCVHACVCLLPTKYGTSRVPKCDAIDSIIPWTKVMAIQSAHASSRSGGTAGSSWYGPGSPTSKSNHVWWSADLGSLSENQIPRIYSYRHFFASFYKRRKCSSQNAAMTLSWSRKLVRSQIWCSCMHWWNGWRTWGSAWSGSNSVWRSLSSSFDYFSVNWFQVSKSLRARSSRWESVFLQLLLHAFGCFCLQQFL